MLGAGGAARAAVWALRSRGRQVYVVNRTLARAERLTAELGGAALPLAEVPWSQLQLVINASSAGLNDAAESPLPHLDFSLLPPGALIYDMVYRPVFTRLMQDARAAGVRTENGLGMLAHQARLAFIAWTDCSPDISVFRAAISAATGAGEA